MEIHHFSHKHPLTLADKVDIFACCSACENLVSSPKTPSYRCNEYGCWFHIHKSCAELPRETRHPFHPQHPLTLLPHPLHGSTEFRCRACGKNRQGFSYHCSDCQFDLDVRCASLIPNSINYGEEAIDDDDHHLFHAHPLVLCEKTKSFDLSCTACELPFLDSIFVCLDCELLLHKSCAKLPLKIEHPFHPQHPLVLFTRIPSGENFTRCSACKTNSQRGFTYRCVDCKFTIGTDCASLVPRKFEFHEHPLALVEKTHCYCNQCPCKKCSGFLCCVPCGFSLHLHCIPTLPNTVERSCHRHPLALTNAPIKDHSDEDESAEFYCDACEEARYLYDPTYYCEDCHYVAHVQCMISKEEILSLGEEYSFLVDQNGERTDTVLESSSKIVEEVTNIKQGILEENDAVLDSTNGTTDLTGPAELDEEIASLTAKLEALKQKRISI